jgi:K+-sensing histidine kinase KdpD
MVCVTLQNTCHKLLDYATSIKSDDDKLFVLHVAKNGQNFMGAADEANILEFLYSVSQKINADMTVLHSDNIGSTILEFVKSNGISTVILGTPDTNSKDNGLISLLASKLNNDIDLVLIDKKGENNSESIFNRYRP